MKLSVMELQTQQPLLALHMNHIKICTLWYQSNSCCHKMRLQLPPGMCPAKSGAGCMTPANC
jgi:hypothetical protein